MGLNMKRETVSRFVILCLVLVASFIFISMIWNYLMAIFLAAITAALLYPLFQRLIKWFGGRRTLAAGITILIFLLVIIVPLGALLGVITGQAINVGQTVSPWIQSHLNDTKNLPSILKQLPYSDYLLENQDEILQKLGQLVGAISRFLINSLSSFTLMTVQFIFMTFIFLYTLFFFFLDGEDILQKFLYYLPLENEEEQQLLHKFTSVTRATLKGTLVIGAIQGSLAGIAFAVVGIPSAVFWGTIMTVLSVIPLVGAGLVWAPAAVVLIINGSVTSGIGLAIFCALVVGSADNILRPRLVGKDTQMHELLIFFGTLGGLAIFGIMGFVIGPIIAALFITLWEIYGRVFKDLLPEVGPIVESIKKQKKKIPEKDTGNQR
jgi:predicted PurR-regulated permease PerM